MEDASSLAQFGALGIVVALLLSVFSYVVKRMLDHVLRQHAEISAERFADMKSSIANFGERLGRVEQELSALRAVEEFSRGHHRAGSGVVTK